MKKKLLLIEDNEQNIYLIKFLLEKNDFQVDEARSGGDGIKKALLIKPDMILLDIQLPDIDGYSVANELKKVLKFAGIKDVYSKTFGSQRTTSNLVKACMDALGKTNMENKKWI